MGRLATINLKRWIDENRSLLKPPVGNKLIYEDREFIVMVVGGPNSRTDYHVNSGEEFFYQVEGDITLKVFDEGKHQDVHIAEGEIFLLPPSVPHSPRRPAGTVGLVVEHKRDPGEKDGFIWFCEKCGEKLYEEYFQLTNIVTQFPPVFERFYKNEKHSTCAKCGHKLQDPDAKN
ncbi:MAG: 3-hydroxyanthranilate 3,4-dioxygenase [Cyanobacteria bacterium SZAS LIN-2]|nr:3-hydroxyanthranilate 3,4-dioxygenase [Cyanobacteria bacterium SZAS LIN-3]MBS1999601.1 3-hydroxyanthranilate 3,4-dioxygenase [Cyanobacteria bacterium SZAS LIN-2]MBS2010643.1 3-hydroxyanthranilate 3,4-dioxygenase [Cyanobacteria bacterium SZAS TMP-1]